MRIKISPYVPALLAVIILVAPQIVHAQIVSCTGLNCEFCSIGQMVQKIINFLIGVSVPIATALFAYAGFIYATAGGNPGKIGKAHSIFANVGIGFILALIGWLVINTILTTLLANGVYAGGKWFSIPCTSSRQISGSTFATLLQGLVMAPATNTGTISIDNFGNTTTVNSDGSKTTVDANGNVINTPSNGTGGGGVGNGSNAKCLDSNTNCSKEALMAAGWTESQANAMSCIAVTENSGNSSGCTGNACGTFQIMITRNDLNGPSCAQFNNGNSSIKCTSLCKGANGAATQTAACQPCVQAVQNAACNAESAHSLYQQSGYQPWTCAGCNSKAQGCVNAYDR